jgi:hypothetical protein
MGKRLSYIGIGIVVLLVVGVGILYLSLNRMIRSVVETYGPRATKSEITLGSVNVSPFSGNASLSNLIVGNPEGFKAPNALTLGAMRVSLDVNSVMSDTVAIREIVITAPEITYEVGPRGSNLAVLQKNVEEYTGDGPSESAQPPAQTGRKQVSIDRLRIEKARLLVRAVPLQGEPVTVALPDIELKDIGKGSQGTSMAAVVEKVLEEISRHAAKAVANVDVKGLADKARKEAEGVKGVVGGVEEKLKGIFRK